MYKSIKRKVDELGRVVLPLEVRTALNINEKDELSIDVKDNKIVLKKVQISCVTCKKIDDSKIICLNCIAKTKKNI